MSSQPTGPSGSESYPINPVLGILHPFAPKLGPRQIEILKLLLQGCESKEIAKQLHMAPRTVKVHFSRLFMKFGIQGGIKRVKLAVYLYRNFPEWR